MWTEITNLLAICVSYASSVFLVVVAACGGAMAAFFGVFIMHQAVRLFLSPLIGTASSDTVRSFYGSTRLGRYNRGKRDDEITRHATSRRGRENAQRRFDARPRRG